MNALIKRHQMSEEYTAIVEYMARRHLWGQRGDALPANISVAVDKEINSDLSRFRALVSARHKALFGY